MDNLPGVTQATAFHHDFSQVPVSAKTPIIIQPKLRINTPGDEYELEADRIAEQVMRGPAPQLRAGAANEYLGQQHGTSLCKSLQPKRVGANDAGKSDVPPIVHDVLRSSGHRLDSSTRLFMEPRFGHDFSQVRVHTGKRAAAAASAINARAFTVDANIVFGSQEYAPRTESGRRLLSHELAHVLQQQTAVGASRTAQKTLMRQAIGAEKKQARLRSPLFAGVPELEMIYDSNLTIGPGANGEFVRRIQIALLLDNANALPKHGADGDYGTETKAAMVRYQKTHCVKISHGKVTVLVPNGVVGRETMDCLDSVVPEAMTSKAATELTAHFKRNPKASKSDVGLTIELGLEAGEKATEKGLNWAAERGSERLVEKGMLVDNFYKIRQSPGKTKAGKWKHLGGMTRRGKFSTKGGGKPYSALGKEMKGVGKFVGEALGPAMDMKDIGKAMKGETSAMNLIADLLAGGLPISMVAEDEMSKMDVILFDTALEAGYEATVNYIENCRTCRAMTEGMALLFVTSAEYEAAFSDELLVTESIRIRILTVHDWKRAGLEFYQKQGGVESPLDFAILLYRAAAGKGKLVQPIAGFPLPP